MKLDQLLYFVEAAKQEHVGRAAKALAISPSAVSHSISSLEEQFGRELFAKRGKRIYLTSHGKVLLERATRLLSDAEAIRDAMASEDVELTGHQRLAATHLLCSRYLTPIWSQLQNENPKLTAEIFTLRSSQVVTGVTAGELDAGLCFNPQEHPELNRKVITEGTLVPAVRRGHPITKKRREERIQLLSDFPAVLPKAFRGVDICETHPVFEKFQIRPRANCLVDSYEVGMVKVATSLFWGFFPDWLVQEHRELVSLPTPKGWEASYAVTVIWSKNRLLSRVTRQLMDRLQAAFTSGKKR